MADRVEITGPTGERYVEILSPKALELLAALHDALDKAEKQALKHKEKIVGRKRNGKVGKEDLPPEAIAI